MDFNRAAATPGGDGMLHAGKDAPQIQSAVDAVRRAHTVHLDPEGEFGEVAMMNPGVSGCAQDTRETPVRRCGARSMDTPCRHRRETRLGDDSRQIT